MDSQIEGPAALHDHHPTSSESIPKRWWRACGRIKFTSVLGALLTLVVLLGLLNLIFLVLFVLANLPVVLFRSDHAQSGTVVHGPGTYVDYLDFFYPRNVDSYHTQLSELSELLMPMQNGASTSMLQLNLRRVKQKNPCTPCTYKFDPKLTNDVKKLKAWLLREDGGYSRGLKQWHKEGGKNYADNRNGWSFRGTPCQYCCCCPMRTNCLPGWSVPLNAQVFSCCCSCCFREDSNCYREAGLGVVDDYRLAYDLTYFDDTLTADITAMDKPCPECLYKALCGPDCRCTKWSGRGYRGDPETAIGQTALSELARHVLRFYNPKQAGGLPFYRNWSQTEQRGGIKGDGRLENLDHWRKFFGPNLWRGRFLDKEPGKDSYLNQAPKKEAKRDSSVSFDLMKLIKQWLLGNGFTKGLNPWWEAQDDWWRVQGRCRDRLYVCCCSPCFSQCDCQGETQRRLDQYVAYELMRKDQDTSHQGRVPAPDSFYDPLRLCCWWSSCCGCCNSEGGTAEPLREL